MKTKTRKEYRIRFALNEEKTLAFPKQVRLVHSLLEYYQPTHSWTNAENAKKVGCQFIHRVLDKCFVHCTCKVFESHMQIRPVGHGIFHIDFFEDVPF